MKSSLLPLLLVSAALAMTNNAKAELQVGDKAPEVTGITETGQKLAFADVYAKQTYTLVYFYPKADTSGCTAQGCSLRDAYEVLTKKGVAVIGVSLDEVDAQKAFKDKYHFPFTLIADPDKVVVNAFGVADHARALRDPAGLPDQGRQDRLDRLQGEDRQAGRRRPRGRRRRPAEELRRPAQSSPSGAAGRAEAPGSSRTRAIQPEISGSAQRLARRATAPRPGR